MAKFPVSSEKEAALFARMQQLGIQESELVENFIKGGGPGGQKINKNASCVQLLHAASGIEIRCQEARSQALNRFLARRLLCERLEALLLGEESQAQKEREKIRRQKRKRSKRAKEKMLKSKHLRAEIKSQRAKIKDA